METENKNPTQKARQEREVRFGTLDAVTREGEGESSDDQYFHVRGKAVVIGEKTKLYTDSDGNDVFEIMEPGCFDHADISDVVFNVNHGDGSYGVARTRNGTLKLDIKADGVYTEALLKKSNPRAAQVHEDISEGILDKMSFAFIIGDESFDEKENCFHVKSVSKCFDVSAVEFPAYGSTSISAVRSATLVSAAEKRAVALKTDQERKAAMGLVDSLMKKTEGNDQA